MAQKTVFYRSFSNFFAAAMFLAWLGLLWWLSSRSHIEVPGPDIPQWDKILHFGYFALGGVLWAFAVGVRGSKGMLVLVFVFLLVGFTDELHQSCVPGRSGNDAGDLVADVTGGAAGAACLLWLLRKCAGRSAG